MSDLRNAAQQALEALDSDNPEIQLRAAITLRAALEQEQEDWSRVDALEASLREHMSEIHRLRATLEREQAEPEPVAWMCPDDPERETAFNWKAGHCENCGKQRIPLYTVPQQRKPLTEEEIYECHAPVGSVCSDADCPGKAAPLITKPADFVSLLREADEIVRAKPTWRRFIDGTPLSNDIAVWMVVFAQDVARRNADAALRADADRYRYLLGHARRIDVAGWSISHMEQLSPRIDAARDGS